MSTTINATTTRTVRSFCRVCTSVCGILVDVDGDDVVRGPRRSGPSPVTRLHLRQGPRSPADAPPPGSARTSSGARRRRTAAHDVGGVPRRSRRPRRCDHRRARPVCGRHLLRQRQRHGRHRVPHGPGVARQDRHPRQVQPAHHRRYRQGADLRPRRWRGRAQRPARSRARRAPARHRQQPRGLARPLGRHPRSGVDAPRAGRSRRDLGDRPAPHRDRAVGDASSRAAAGHRLRSARVPRPGTAPRRCRSDRAGRARVRAWTRSRPRSNRSPRDHAARLADVEGADLDRLLAAVRRVGRVAIDTGTGVTMARSANVTQWLAWAVDDPHRLHEPAGWLLVPPRLRTPARGV